VNRRRAIAMIGGASALLVGIPAGWSAYTAVRFPSDRTPEGAYLRIALAFGKGRLEDCFPYLETEAQHALYSIHDFRKRSLALVRKWFDEPEKSRLIEDYHIEGDAPDPPGTWAALAKARGWDTRMRRDLSGIQSVERSGPRATVVTVRGTRYPFRQADNEIWGLTLFTAELVNLRERASRDFDMVERAAGDYERVKGK